MKPLPYSAISSDFDETLGYIRNDIRAISGGTHTVNYTLMLLVGCGCEILATVRAGKKTKGYRVFKELVPTGEWRVLAGQLYNALRNGLAHGFDTKRLIVGGLKVQIHMSWPQKEPFHLRPGGQKIALMLGPRPLAEALCLRIDEFEQLLRKDEGARIRFQSGCNCERTTEFKPHEEVAWKTLVKAAKL